MCWPPRADPWFADSFKRDWFEEHEIYVVTKYSLHDTHIARICFDLCQLTGRRRYQGPSNAESELTLAPVAQRSAPTRPFFRTDEPRVHLGPQWSPIHHAVTVRISDFVIISTFHVFCICVFRQPREDIAERGHISSIKFSALLDYCAIFVLELIRNGPLWWFSVKWESRSFMMRYIERVKRLVFDSRRSLLCFVIGMRRRMKHCIEYQ